MNIQWVELRNFGPHNFCLRYTFHRQTCFAQDNDLIEAFKCLLDPNYKNDSVTKKRTGIHSSARIRFANHTIVRYFEDPNSFEIDGKDVSPKHYYQRMDRFLFHILEPFNTTPTNIVDQIIEQVASRRFELQDKLFGVTIKSKLCTEIMRQHIPPTQRTRDIENVKYDQQVSRRIRKLNREWLTSTANPKVCETMYEQLVALFPNDPKEPVAFNNAVVNVFIAHLQFDISDHQKRVCLRSMITYSDEDKAVKALLAKCATILRPTVLYKLYLGTAISENTFQYAENQYQAYSINDNLYLKYKQDFLTNDAWENEKAAIRLKRRHEQTFYDELENKERIKKAELEEVRDILAEEHMDARMIVVTVKPTEENKVTKPISWILSSINSYLHDCMLPLVNEFSEELCEILNHPTLEIANINECIAGLIHSIINSGYEQPEYLFDHINSHKKGLLGNVETFLAPMSRVLFFEQPEVALGLQERIMAEPMAQSYETTFIFAAHESIKRKVREEGEVPRLLSNIGKSIFYKQSLSNLLSNFKVTNADVPPGQNSNLLNLHTRRIDYASCESKGLHETNKHLFIQLRIITSIYKDIRSNLNDHKDWLDEFIEKATLFVDAMHEYYRVQSEYYSNLLKIRSLSLKEHNLRNTLAKLKCLKSKSKNRLKIYDQLLLLQDADEESDARFIETLALQKFDQCLSGITTLNNVYDTAPTDTLDITRLHDNVDEAHMEILNSVKDPLEVAIMTWRQASADFIVDPQDPLPKKLSAIKGINFHRIAICVSKFPRREPTNRTEAQIFGDIDRIIPTLRLSMIPLSVLSNIKKKLNRLTRCDLVCENIFNVAQEVMVNCDESIKSNLNSICTALNQYVDDLQLEEGIAGGYVHCDLQGFTVSEMEYDKIDWTSHILAPRRIVPSIRIYADHPKLEQDLLPILFYAQYILKFTSQPLILHNMLKGRDEKRCDKVIEYMTKTLLYTGQFFLVNFEVELMFDGLDVGYSLHRIDPDADPDATHDEDDARRGAGVAHRGAGVARRGAGVARRGAGVARRGAGVARRGAGGTHTENMDTRQESGEGEAGDARTVAGVARRGAGGTHTENMDTRQEGGDGEAGDVEAGDGEAGVARRGAGVARRGAGGTHTENMDTRQEGGDGETGDGEAGDARTVAGDARAEDRYPVTSSTRAAGTATDSIARRPFLTDPTLDWDDDDFYTLYPELDN